MNKISIDEAKNIIYASEAKYIAQEQITIYYDNFSGLIDIDTYYTNECLVVKKKYNLAYTRIERKIRYHFCNSSG